jgi:predicted nucleotidyltransferase/uncharacterized protein (UPF0332 family)
MEKDYNLKPENKYANKDTNSDLKIDDIDLLKQRVAEQAAKIEAQKRAEAEKIQNLMNDTAKKADALKKEILKKHKKHMVGILIMPPKPSQKLESQVCKPEEDEEKLDILCIAELKDIADLKARIKKKAEIEGKIKEIAEQKLKGHNINVVLIEEVWDMCLKGKYEILNILTMGFPLYDRGWVGAIRATEIHKMKVLQKFEKYVISYAIAGSIVRGEATAESDIDTFVVIDDTDVTRLTAAELRSRLLSMIWGYAHEATMAAGVKNTLETQVYVLSEMWDALKNATPTLVTLLRDGIPLYDRGMFAPWKMLLNKGRINPTPEAITQFMKAGDQMVKRTESRLKEIAIEDFYWATSTPTQGALMLLGFPPPPPKKLGDAIRKHLVKPGLIEEKYAKVWDRIITLRKDIEHGKIKEVDAIVVAKLLADTKDYLKRLDKMFNEIEKKKICEEMEFLYEKTVEDCHASLAMLGIKATKATIFTKFKTELVDRKFASQRYYQLIERIKILRKNCDTTRENISSLSFEQDKLARDVFNIIRAEHGQKIEKFKISAQYNAGKSTAAVWLFTDEVFIIRDTNDPNTAILKYSIEADGSFEGRKESNLGAIENKLKKFSGTPTTMTKKTIDSLKEVLGDDVKLVIGA